VAHIWPLGGAHPDAWRCLFPPRGLRLYVVGSLAIMAPDPDSAWRMLTGRMKPRGSPEKAPGKPRESPGKAPRKDMAQKCEGPRGNAGPTINTVTSHRNAVDSAWRMLAGSFSSVFPAFPRGKSLLFLG
jgi:hypothetical protein